MVYYVVKVPLHYFSRDKLLGETSTKLGVLRSLPTPISLDVSKYIYKYTMQVYT